MIKFVYFDIGGVTIRDFSDNNKWEIFKKDFGITDEYWNEFEPKLCVGEADTPLTEEFVKRFEINKSIWPVIKKLKQKYRIGLLTNMYPRMLDLIKKRGLLPPVDWEIIIDSSVVKLQKPDPRIYKLAEKEAGFQGKEIFYVENSPGQVKAAKKLDWHTFLYDSANPEKSSHQLDDYLRLNDFAAFGAA